MSRTFHHGDRRIRIRGVRRERPDLPKLARALIDIALAQAEAEAQAEHETRAKKNRKRPQPKRDAA